MLDKLDNVGHQSGNVRGWYTIWTQGKIKMELGNAKCQDSFYPTSLHSVYIEVM